MDASEFLSYILATLIRWKLFEAFIIPTGAMAPTIYGAHSDVLLPELRFHVCCQHVRKGFVSG